MNIILIIISIYLIIGTILSAMFYILNIRRLPSYQPIGIREHPYRTTIIALAAWPLIIQPLIITIQSESAISPEEAEGRKAKKLWEKTIKRLLGD
jgi:hypothetical protein